MKNGWFSTGFSAKKWVFHSFTRVFHTVFRRKSAFPRFFFVFLTKSVENPVEIVEK
jgi:hypothetical protein